MRDWNPRFSVIVGIQGSTTPVHNNSVCQEKAQNTILLREEFNYRQVDRYCRNCTIFHPDSS